MEYYQGGNIMKEYIKIMDHLISTAAKEPNSVQKTEYYKAFYQMLNEEGFTNVAQEYMYKGFKYIKMKPFKAYFILKDDSEKEELLNQLFKSDYLKKDKPKYFSILINLLALFISGKVGIMYCKDVAREIPNYCYNKDGEIIGNANGLMMNNFYSALTVIPNNYEFEKLFDSEQARAQFEELLADSIAYASSAKKLTTRQKDTVECVKEWISWTKTQTQKEKTEDYLHLTENSQGNALSKEVAKLSHVESNTCGASRELVHNTKKDSSVLNSASLKEDPHSTEEKENAPDKNLSADKNNEEILNLLLHRINQLHSLVEKSNENTATLTRSQQVYIDSLKNAVDMVKANNDLIRQRNIELTDETRNLKKKVEELRSQLVEKEEEANSLNALLEVSSKEGDLKFKGEILKLTEKLRFEYQDYMSAKNIPMSIDLGENMRGQLGDIFTILMKAGLDIDT